MTRELLQRMTVDQLVVRFTAIALDEYEAILDEENETYRRLFDDMENVRSELKRREGDQRRALIPLFDHQNPQVRLKAAISTLAIVPYAARRVLQSIVDRQEYPQAADARGIMRSL